MSDPTPPLAAGARGPLEGMVVVDLTRALSGPRATWLLAGLGATVIKIESTGIGDTARLNSPYVGPEGLGLSRRTETDMSLSILNRCPGKHSVTLDLKKPGALEIYFDLARRADVVVENYTAGTADRLGIGYAATREVNPRVVYCSISGFGQDSDPGVPVYDNVIQALSGLMMANGGTDDPPIRVGIPIADNIAPLFAVVGILAALRGRDQTGRGQYVDISMLGALTSLVATEDWETMERLGQPLRTGPTLPRLVPFGMYPCRDGYVSIVAPQDAMAHELFRAMGRPELIEDPGFGTRDGRIENPWPVEQAIEEWTSGHTVSQVVDILQAVRIGVAPVRTQIEALNDPRVISRGETRPVIHPDLGEIPGIRASGIPITFSEPTSDFTFPAQHLGEDNDAVYGGFLGYSDEHIDELRRTGTI